MTSSYAPIAVLGAGSWGTALALRLTRNDGQTVHLWEFDKAQVLAMQRDRCNEKYAPSILFPSTLSVTDSLQDALVGVRDILIVVPSFAFRQTVSALKPFVNSQHRIAWATKGIDDKTAQLFDQVVRELLGERSMAVLSGPSFARDVLLELPTAVSLASNDENFLQDLSGRFNCNVFRVYTSRDLVGVQLGGAIKNVMAIATGICDGLKIGANAHYAMITRGLAEMIRLGVAMGANRETFTGLSGIGDLTLTCGENQSRNRRLGLALALGGTLESFEKSLGQVVEGVHVVSQVLALAKQYHVEMPICEQVSRILNEKIPPKEVVGALLSRAVREEFD